MANRIYKLDPKHIKGRREGYHFNLDFIVFREGEVLIAYCPALDISTSGANYNEAISNFYEMFQLHVECCLEEGTLEKDLLSHGWKLDANAVKPPTLSKLTGKPEMKRLFSSDTNFERIAAPASLPAFV